MVHNIPYILLYDIAGLCSPNTLVSLAQTHSSFKREAEKALYRRTSFMHRDYKSLRCMETLATNSEKAGFVRFLTMECGPHEKTNENPKAMFFLVRALINMHSLSDFRLSIRSDQVDTWAKEIDKVLCEDHFRLQTLFCDDYLDIPRIIKNQTKLQTLGIYGCSETLLETLKQLHSAQVSLPVVFQLYRDTWDDIYNVVYIYPAFHSIDRIPTIPQVLIKSFDQVPYFPSRARADSVGTINIHLADSSDMSSIHALAKNVAVCFPSIKEIEFCFERPCEIPSADMMQIISLFPDLHQLCITLWDAIAGPKVPEDIKRAHVREWTVACPELLSVTFIDGSTLRKTLSMSDEWNFI